MMIWHGGLSGSAPLKIAEEGHFLMEKTGIVGVGETLFSSMNITAFVLVIVSTPSLIIYTAINTLTNKVLALLLHEKS